MRADLGAGVDRAAIEADATTTRRAVGGDLAGVGAEARCRILGRDSALQCGAAQVDVFLVETELAERLAVGDAHLRLHEVDVGDLLGHGVLHLDARVHLDEHVLALALPRGVEQELDGAGVDVANRLREGDRVTIHRLAGFLVEVRGRRDLDHLLVATLHRAVAFEQVNGLPRGIRENLHFDVARTHHCLLEEHGRVAEGAIRLAHGLEQSGAEVFFLLDPSHPSPAAASDGLGKDGKADGIGTGQQFVEIFGRGSRGKHGNARGDRMLLGRDLIARHFEHMLARADEGDAGGRGRFSELGVLREESIARVDGVGAAFEGDTDDLRDIQVCAHRMPGLADLVGLVSLEAMHGVAVLIWEDSDRLGAKLIRRTKSTDCDFATIGYEDLGEHLVLSELRPA